MKEEMKEGVTCIVNLHDEGHLAWRSLRSAWRALEVFLQAHPKLYAELVIVQDFPSDETINIVGKFIDEKAHDNAICIHPCQSDYGDLGLARNLGAHRAYSNHVAFLDGDDLMGEEWLAKGYDYLNTCNFPAVAHPQVNINFERDMMWWQHTDSRDKNFDPSTFCVTNHWTALSMAKRELYLAHPYARASIDDGTGFEDWEWNTRTLANDIAHVVVPETVHFIRRRSDSMSTQHSAQNRATKVNAFWDKMWRNKQAEVVSPKGLSDWLQRQWLAIHSIEAELFPHTRELQQRPQYTPPKAKDEWLTYHKLNSAIAQDTTHIVFFAGLGGGADIRVRHYADAIKQQGGKLCLVATDGRTRGVIGHDVIEVHNAMKTMHPFAQARVLQRLMRQRLADGVIVHVVNSAVAWGALGQNTKLFAKHRSRVFGSLYARQLFADGSSGGYAFNGSFSSSMQALGHIFTDNHNMSIELANYLGWEDTTVVPTPVEQGLPSMHAQNAFTSDVLWAGSIEWNKNLGALVDLAIKNPGIRFHIYGTANDYAGRDALSRAALLPNCIYHGPFGSWTDIKGTYDAFIVTSHNEGTPNIALEALARGLPVLGFEKAVGDCPSAKIFPGEELPSFIGKHTGPFPTLETMRLVMDERGYFANIAKRRSQEVEHAASAR